MSTTTASPSATTPATTTLFILGATGDLTSRLLLPSLASLLCKEQKHRVILRGSGTEEWDAATWRATIEKAFADQPQAMDRVEIADYMRADVTDASAVASLVETLDPATVLYFALPPAVTAAAIDAMEGLTLPEGTVLAMEKPFGQDEQSAHELNQKLLALVPEKQIFRVDHFLGRSTLLNLLGVRLANRIWEPVWSAEHIEQVLIRFDESVALEGRARYYDKAGAMIDMIQSHLLQVLALLAMDPPATLHERDLRDAKAAVLRATHVMDDDPARWSRRAQYTAGTQKLADGGSRELPSYRDEEGVDNVRKTETLAEVVFEVASDRWTGVPFILRSGKGLDRKHSEIVVTFKPVRHLPPGLTGSPSDGGRLTFSLGPDEMHLRLHVTGGDDPFALRDEDLVTELGVGQQRSYEEVLDELLDGDVALSVRADEAEECWRIIQPVRDAWARGETPLDEYPAGSTGPASWKTSQAS
ncbi:glucose-6-phosphate dehydrogenase [Microbacterium esteraromaticum]|uniref:glucose-6-phosphate dehydrogenase n=1 Tax=Microbacterium esteraromaticum TaxID=57043 RepID=UPI0019566E1D|nr:glucose-6-phosphate dehydrogenase [Microbacterium esteraromaticum]MBM7465840.1 glucose-6-phosphate 1-dehydrogenase [Microbacterium esteraromaticum]